MRAVLQRVLQAAVEVGGERIAAVGPGLLVLLGVGRDDGPADVDAIAEKIVHLRIFADAAGHMNRSVKDVGGELLVVSQFTLYADSRRGRRPSYTDAAPPEVAEPLYRACVERLRGSGLVVREGIFRADMKVSLTNDGPVTLLLDTRA